MLREQGGGPGLSFLSYPFTTFGFGLDFTHSVISNEKTRGVGGGGGGGGGSDRQTEKEKHKETQREKQADRQTETDRKRDRDWLGCKGVNKCCLLLCACRARN